VSLSFARRQRNQTAIYWRAAGTDRYGRPTFEAPTEINCRWDDQEQVLRGPQGVTLTFNGAVYVDRQMAIGDRLKKGAMESTTPDDPTEDKDAIAVQRFDATPDMKGRASIYRAYL
jgi:hypothetical protein